MFHTLSDSANRLLLPALINCFKVLRLYERVCCNSWSGR